MIPFEVIPDPAVVPFQWPAETWDYIKSALLIGVFSLGAWLGVTL